MASKKPKPAKGPPRPNVGNEPIDPPDLIDPDKHEQKHEPRPGAQQGEGTSAERAGSLEKAPGE